MDLRSLFLYRQTTGYQNRGKTGGKFAAGLASVCDSLRPVSSYTTGLQMTD
jgi:hypothetical protein